MTQRRTFDYHAPRTGALLNEKMRRATPAVLTEEMDVSKGTDDFDVTLGVGAWVSHEGIAVYEDAALEDVVTLDEPDAQDRIDVIYGTLTYEADTEPTPASYGVLKGTPGASPAEPACGPSQVKLASIYVPSDASDLDDCYVRSAGALKAWLSGRLGFTIEASVYKQPFGDPFIVEGTPTLQLIYEYGIQDGDIWVETDGLDIYVYDASTNTWVAGDVLAHAPTHSSGGTDEVDIKNLADSLGYRHLATRASHEAMAIRHQYIGSIGVDDHHARDHASRHSSGGADVVDVKNLADTEAYLHKTHPGLAPSPHDNDYHSVPYSENPHTNADHAGTIAAGFIGGGSIVGPVADTPEGENVYQWEMIDFALDDTTLYYTKLRVKVTSAPSDSIVFTFKLNGVELGTVTIAVGQTVGTTDITPDVELALGDIIQLDGPADNNGAKGCIPAIGIARVGVVV